MLNLNSIMLGSSQPKVMAEFYEKVFEKPADMAEGDWAGWVVGNGFLSVGPHSEITGSAKEPARILFNFETTELLGEFERVKAIGATVIKAPYKMQESDAEPSVCTFADPDGNYFQLVIPWK